MIALDRITFDPDCMNGQPCLRGLRLTVRRVIEITALYPDRAERLLEYPELEDEDVRRLSTMRPSSCRIRSFPLILMRWLLDQGLPRGAAAELNRSVHEAIHVGEVQMAQSSDSEILAYGLKENRVVVTLDADFHALLAISRADRPSVIRIREEGFKARELAALLLRIADRFSEELESGCMMTFSQGKVRTRSLPL